MTIYLEEIKHLPPELQPGAQDVWRPWTTLEDLLERAEESLAEEVAYSEKIRICLAELGGKLARRAWDSVKPAAKQEADDIRAKIAAIKEAIRLRDAERA